jgi:2-phosphoglycerate kinase
MIYLIGGPPKCGKTTLAKMMLKKFGIPWISTDTLQNVGWVYFSKKDKKSKFPSKQLKVKNNDEKYKKYSIKEIITAYIKQANTAYKAVDMFALCEIKDGNDYIIEGYHIEPKLAYELIKKYGTKNIRPVFLVKSDQNKFIKDIKKSTTPNDWILARTKNIATYAKIAEMVCEYSKYFKRKVKKYNYKVYNTDKNFNKQLNKAIRYLKK